MKRSNEVLKDAPTTDASTDKDRRTTEPRTLTGKLHPELPIGARVLLSPRIGFTAGPAGTIDAIQLRGRTPSPFGAAMGDHTVAWQALVDAVRAALHGRSAAEAVAELRVIHGAADRWQADAFSLTARLLAQLGDEAGARRVPRLEDADFRTVAALDRAAATPAQAAAELATAVAQHLAYLNYLPFATVPAAGSRGSVGSGEGTYRGTLVAFEQEKAPDVAETLAATDPRRAALRTALWKLFAFDAALREATIPAVLDPEIAVPLARAATRLLEIADGLDTLAVGLSVAPDTTSFASLMPLGTELETLRTTIGPRRFVRISGTEFAVHIVSLRGQVDAMQQLALGTTKDRKTKSGPVASAAKEAAMAARTLADGEVAAAKAAPARAAALLAAMLHEHLHTVATAYPRSVLATGLLTVGAEHTGADAALEELRRRIASSFPPAPGAEAERHRTALDTLGAALRTEYTALPPIITATRNGWAAQAANASLVVVYNPAVAPRVTCNGRADAPAGVAGMGCHTTAWVLEVEAVRRLLATAATPADALRTLAADVRTTHAGTNAAGTVLALDRYLPAGQLAAGQLVSVFDEATAVLTAATLPAPADADVATAIEAYLSWRNLLPFATVDEGDRGGHAERADADARTLFDGEALGLAAQTARQPLATREIRQTTVEALTLAADLLQAGLDDTAWPDLVDPVKAATTRLRARATELTTKAAAATNPADVIVTARWAEHRETYQRVHPGAAVPATWKD
ncbi:hypothetical protein ND748_27005 [Frankia sp. AiPs1]|uniref:hypothetical protein n=1 Tax=Frankia sp. AiPs1 TaxID=573493 RepID=UPI002044136A|nr:hypothetical protein [Frankia sp. AiPs1]MCM3925305.1 hypothetical protein [Frankia sp. AiPs1]